MGSVPQRARRHAAVVMIVLASLVASACGSDPAEDTSGACSAATRARCDGTRKVFCADDGTLVYVDCADRGLACVTDSAGTAACAMPCDGQKVRASCDGSVLTVCSGQVLTRVDCAVQGLRCAYSTFDDAACTKPCPPEIDALGTCEGPRLRRCDGGIFYDVDCSSFGQTCARDASGGAYCGVKCAADVPQFGKCDGTKLTLCSGELFYELDCASVGGTCERIGRGGYGCHRCNEVKDTCEGGVATTCAINGTQHTESCAASGASCGFDTERCGLACVGGKSGRTCAADRLTTGQSRCRTAPKTGFSTIALCLPDGSVEESECAAASDGSVRCAEENGVARCSSVTSCGASKMRCTDRDVLTSCDDLTSWTDCSFWGGRCVPDAAAPYCSCETLRPEATRCSRGKRATCKNGRLEFEACTC